MAPLIRAVLSNLIGEEDSKTIEIIANDVILNDDLSWNIQFRHPTRYAPPRAEWRRDTNGAALT